MSTKLVDRWLERYQREAVPVIRRVFGATRIILLGSRVKARASEDSDIDVILVSASFENVPFLKRMPMVLERVPFPKHVAYMCYTPEEFERIKHESAIITDALQECLELDT